jgi:hypothetical protein
VTGTRAPALHGLPPLPFGLGEVVSSLGSTVSRAAVIAGLLDGAGLAGSFGLMRRMRLIGITVYGNAAAWNIRTRKL